MHRDKIRAFVYAAGYGIGAIFAIFLVVLVFLCLVGAAFGLAAKFLTWLL